MSIRDQEDFLDDDVIICEACGRSMSIFDLSFNTRAEQRSSEFNYCEACWEDLKFEMQGGCQGSCEGCECEDEEK